MTLESLIEAVRKDHPKDKNVQRLAIAAEMMNEVLAIKRTVRAPILKGGEQI